MSDTSTTSKVLVINVGVEPIETEKYEFPLSNPDLARETILTVMNRMGKNSEALVKAGDKWFTYSHTSVRGPSKKLYPARINYHPMMKELL